MFSVMSVCSQGWSRGREVQVNKIEQQEPVVRGGGFIYVAQTCIGKRAVGHQLKAFLL